MVIQDIKSSKSPALQWQTFETSDAVNLYIYCAAQHQNQRMLKLFAHRIALSFPHWFMEKDNQLIEKKIVHLLSDYISCLPTLIEEFNGLCSAHHWFDVSETGCHVIDSFLKETEQSISVGVLNLLDKAYFSHRLLEELHDHMMCQLGVPVSNWNMTTVNLFIHQIICERHAAKLDQTVIELASKLVKNAPALSASKKQQDQSFNWPCFGEHHGLKLAY